MEDPVLPAPRTLRTGPGGGHPGGSPVWSFGVRHSSDDGARATREAAVSGRPLREVLAAREDVDVDAPLAAAPDTGEAAAQVDAVLSDHRRLTEGKP